MINPCYKFALTKDEVHATRGVNHRITKVLECMLYGIPAKIGDYWYELAETEDGGIAPLIIINDEERLVQGMPDMSLMTFSELVAKMEDKDYEELTNNYAFSKTISETFRKNRRNINEPL